MCIYMPLHDLLIFTQREPYTAVAICSTIQWHYGFCVETVGVEIIQISDPIALDWNPQHRD
jgi:hypothetical protein